MCLSELRFGAVLAYSTLPEPTFRDSRRSQRARDAIKSGHYEPGKLCALVGRAVRNKQDLEEILNPETVLVPVPRSAPLPDGNAFWPARAICSALERHPLCARVVLALERVKPIRKSAWISRAKDRPSPEEHVATMRVVNAHGLLFPVTQITVVDDVVTRGSQLVGAASLLAQEFPEAKIVAFAALRAMSGQEVARVVDPVVGTITNDGNNRVFRRP